MKFIHYSNTPIIKLRDARQLDHYRIKPKGFWLSDEDSNYGWEEWCTANAPDYLGSLKYEVKLDPKANLLWLRTPEDIDAFTYCYKKAMDIPLQNDDHVMAIDWYQLAKEYDGLIITPYQWTRRLGCPSVWYYAWDVASGVVWKASAIKSIEAL